MEEIKPETFDFIINSRSGTVLKLGEDHVRATLEDQFGPALGSIRFIEGAAVAEESRQWIEAYAGQNRGLIVGGGDGTVVAAAEQAVGHDDVTLGVLPLGTQNRVARRLGFSPDFNIAATQYKTLGKLDMDMGTVNGMPFLVDILFDRNSLSMNQSREDLRDGKRIRALRNVFSAVAGFLVGRRQSFTISEPQDGGTPHHIRGRLLAITDNELSPSSFRAVTREGGMMKSMLAAILNRTDESSGNLCLYAFDAGVLGIARLLPHLIRGTWDRHVKVGTLQSTEFVLQSPAADVKQTEAVVDGERRTLSYPVDVSVVPKGLTFFKPR